MLCDCECERQGNMYEEKSPECNGVGTLKCGVCECYDGFFGKRCECSPHQELTGFDKHFQSCRPDNTTLVDCSGRGTCACGQCECEERENPKEVFSYFSRMSISKTDIFLIILSTNLQLFQFNVRNMINFYFQINFHRIFNILNYTSYSQ